MYDDFQVLLVVSMRDKNRLGVLACILFIHFLTSGGIATMIGFQSLLDFFCVYFFYCSISYIIYCIVEDLEKKEAG